MERACTLNLAALHLIVWQAHGGSSSIIRRTALIRICRRATCAPVQILLIQEPAARTSSPIARLFTAEEKSLLPPLWQSETSAIVRPQLPRVSVSPIQCVRNITYL